MTKKVFLYARRSNITNKDSSISIKGQREDLENACKHYWYKIIWSYSDNCSWYEGSVRNEFNKMMEEINKRNIEWKWEKVDILFTNYTSRLWRNRGDADVLIPLVEKELIQIHSLEEWLYENLDWYKRFLDDVNTAIYESKLKSQNWKKNRDKTYRLWIILPEQPLYWYKIEWTGDYRKWVINNDNNEAELVQKVFHLYSSWEYTYKSLAEHLNKEWYQVSYRKKWKILLKDIQADRIENFLIKEKYAGIVKSPYNNLSNAERAYFENLYGVKITWNSFTVDYSDTIKDKKTYEPLISKFLYDKCRDIRLWKRWKNKVHKKWKYFYHLNGIFKCPCKKGIEKSPYKYHAFTWWQSKWIHYYKCSNNKTLYACDNKNISWLLLEELIYNKFISKIQFSDIEIQIFKEIIQAEVTNTDSRQENISKKIKKKLSNLQSDYDASLKTFSTLWEDMKDIQDDLGKNLKIMKKNIWDLKKELKESEKIYKDEVEYVKDYLFYINNLSKNFLQFPAIRKQEMLLAFFDYIIIYNKEIIDYKMNPIFELAYEKWKVLTRNQKIKKGNKNSENPLFSLKQTKRAQSDDYALDGRSTRNRT